MACLPYLALLVSHADIADACVVGVPGMNGAIIFYYTTISRGIYLCY